MATEITIPSFNWSGFYYAEIYEALIQYMRVNAPELSSEAAQELHIQLLRAYAAVGHLNNGLIDVIANESTLVTAKLASTVRSMLRLIGYSVPGDAPAEVELLMELAQVLSATTTIIPAESQVSTQGDATADAIFFEILSAVQIGRTDQITQVVAQESGVYTDYTSEANNPSGGQEFTPWATPAAGDTLYVVHGGVQWATLNVTLSVAGANIVGVWEVWDGEHLKAKPDNVTDNGATLTFEVDGYLDGGARDGTVVRVQLDSTTAYEDCVVVNSGGINKITTTGLLGQSSPSTDASDYTIGSEWEELDDVVDGTSNLSTSGDVTYTHPQALTRSWPVASADDMPYSTPAAIAGHAMRFRIISVSTPTAPEISLLRIDTGKQFYLGTATQGRTYADPAFSSDGSADQTFQLSKEHFIEESETVTIGGISWVRVDNFLASRSTDRHYVVSLDSDDKATITFGDGVNGAIPAPGVGNVVVKYRHSAHEDGNVGAGTVTLDKTGMTYISSVTNPSTAAGWQRSQAATEAGLERAKIEGPASLRTKDTALGPGDIEDMTEAYVSATGSRPFSRSRVVEEGYGPKTFKNVVVAAGGLPATAAQLDALDEYFNGDQTTYPPKTKRLVGNHEHTATNFTPRAIDVTATVYGPVTVTQVENQLKKLLSPEAVRADGVTWEWLFGGEVPESRISAEMFEVDSEVTKVVMTVPAADTSLNPGELPTVGTLSITVVTP